MRNEDIRSCERDPTQAAFSSYDCNEVLILLTQNFTTSVGSP